MQCGFTRDMKSLCGREVYWEPHEMLGEVFASAVVCVVDTSTVVCYFRIEPPWVRTCTSTAG
jgi:hypothetical protein